MTTGSRPYFAFVCAITGRLIAIGNACPSDEEVLPSPHCSAIGSRCCKLTISARAFAYVSSRMCQSAVQQSFSYVSPGHASAIFVVP